MNDVTIATMLRLQENAERCRRMARQATCDGIARELEKLAQDYDKDASRLEVMAPDLRAALFR